MAGLEQSERIHEIFAGRRFCNDTEVMPGQLFSLFVLAIPVACISWTVTHEDIFQELRAWCERRARARRVFIRKFYRVVSCEYCFSHYVAAGVVAVTRFTLLLPGWRGYLIAGFSLVWIANLYMSLYGRLRLEIKSERVEIEEQERELHSRKHFDARRR